MKLHPLHLHPAQVPPLSGSSAAAGSEIAQEIAMSMKPCEGKDPDAMGDPTIGNSYNRTSDIRSVVLMTCSCDFMTFKLAFDVR